MSAKMFCCPWVHQPQHDRALGIESGGLADFAWMVESLVCRVDGMRPGREDFPVGPNELVRFVAHHEWQDRQAVMDLMEDLSFLLRFYAKGFHAWHRRLASFAWAVTLRARWRAHRRLMTSNYRARVHLRHGLHREGQTWPSSVDVALARNRDLRERLIRARNTDPADLVRIPIPEVEEAEE